MKKQERLVKLYEIGDFVGSGHGFGKVINTVEVYDDGCFIYQDVIIQCKSGDSNNSSNLPVTIEAQYIRLITEDQYNKEGY